MKHWFRGSGHVTSLLPKGSGDHLPGMFGEMVIERVSIILSSKLVFMVGSNDKIIPNSLSLERSNQNLAYYSLAWKSHCIWVGQIILLVWMEYLLPTGYQKS
jgi:hypothetical protein